MSSVTYSASLLVSRFLLLAFTLTAGFAQQAVAASYDLLLSTSANRLNATALDGATVVDNIHVFTSPESGVSRVRFYLDDPTASGAPRQTENKQAYDFAGTGSNNTAKPFDTRQITDGNHTITAQIDLSAGGTETVSANIVVANNGPVTPAALTFSPTALSLTATQGSNSVTLPVTLGSNEGTPAAYTLSSDASWLKFSALGATTPAQINVWADATNLTAGPYTGTLTASAGGYTSKTLSVTLQVSGTSTSTYQLLVSTSSNRSNAGALSGATVVDNIYMFTSPESGVSRVRFYLDDPTASGAPRQTENKQPYDFAGTGSNNTAKPFDTRQITDGNHTITAQIDLSAGGTETVSANFVVTNNGLIDPGIEVVPQLTGFNRVSDQAWDETAVRKVLHTFAFGGQASDSQITAWADMPPAQAITQMLTFDQHNLLLSPVGPQDYDRLDTRDGTLRGLALFWSSDDPDNGIYVAHRQQNEPDRYKNLSWVRATTSRGLNPFRQKIGHWETNYHMAVNQLAGPSSGQIIRYYDDIMNALEQGLPYQDVMTVAALSAAILRQYGQNYFKYGVCLCNEDFAREYYQLFFGILGEYDPFLHETVTIKNTAKALTGIIIPRNDKGDYLDSTQLVPEFHYPDTLSMLNVEIGGSSAPERFEQLAPYAIAHPESLDNLPVKIIQGLADDNLTDEKVESIRSAWRSMQEKKLLDFLRAYAISEIFHDENRVKYLTSVDRHLMFATQMSLNNEENYLDLYDPYGPASFEDEGVVIFQPEHNVFGGQTGIEASESMDIFRNNYNRFTGYPSLWYRRTSINRYGRDWKKDWASVVPRTNEIYQVKPVAEWLWNRFIGDGLKNFGALERAHVYALLATDQDIGYLRDSSDPDRVFGTEDLNSDPSLVGLVEDLSVSEMALDSSEPTERTVANRRMGMAINFILATPYVFAQEGR